MDTRHYLTIRQGVTRSTIRKINVCIGRLLQTMKEELGHRCDCGVGR